MKQRLSLTLCAFFLIFIGCQKQDLSTSNFPMDEKAITQKFFSPSSSLNQRNIGLLNYLRNENDKNEFVIETVSKIGYPRWDKIITTTKKTNSNSNSFGEGGDTVISILPFVQELDTTVKACLVINSTIDDTSYYYLCDWQYNQVTETDQSSYEKEKFATFFMTLNKEVFDYSVFNITDTNLFNMYPKTAIRVKLNEPTTSLQETCTTTTVYFEDCDFQDTDECRNGCDHCWACMSSISWETCIPIFEEGGPVPPSGPSGTGGSGNGGGTTPQHAPPHLCQIMVVDQGGFHLMNLNPPMILQT